MGNRRGWWIFAGGLLLLAAGVALSPLGALLRFGPAVATGYAAEMLCAGVFVSGRDAAQVIHDDILPVDPLLARVTLQVDPAQSLATASLFGLGRRQALFRPGVGCTLVGAGGVTALQQQTAALQPMQQRDRPQPWPTGDQVALPPLPRLDAVLDQAFAGPAGVHTRALLVVHNGRLVAERYADGFTAGSRFLGWSMSKSVTALLLGTLVDSGRLDLAAPAPLATWRTAADGHQQITLAQLLDMTSGLSFRETYAPGDDATRMLYSTDDMGAFAAGQPMAAAPGTVWSYSSGTANILSRLLFDASGGSLATVYDYARTHLFEPAGMTSAVFEPDAAGVPVGSSYLYMTARDWARFGLLVLGRGSIGWHRILSPDWIAATATPARTLDGQPHPYARQFWLNYAEDSTRATALPHCPPDTIMADGHNGQLVAIVPSAHTVVVRLAWDTGPTRFDSDQTLSAILTALKSD